MSSKSRSNNNSSSGCCRRILGCGCTLLICGTLSVLLWHFLGRPSSPEEALDKIRDISLDDFNNVLRNITLDDWLRGFNNDPYVGDNTTFAWESDGTGLKLELQNALDEEWHEIFEAAVQDWQESDALSLSTRKVEVDRECKAVEGVMKVCNANYGATGWLGINEVQFKQYRSDGPKFVLNSVAKMNEYYLHNAQYEKRRYTMCHEVGHGFGLPHTDEDHSNRDLGNCLDYTNTPENNMYPGEVNFARLASIYLRPDQPEKENGGGRVFVRRQYLLA